MGDARETGLDREPPPTVYWCATNIAPGSFFLVRTYGEPKSMAETVRRKIHEFEPRRSAYDLTPLSDHISDAYAENRLRTILLAFFAITAVSLACVGLYGTLSYLVNLRRREVALRLALGAMRAQVVRQFLGLGVRVAVLGCVAGLLMAAGFARLLSGMLYGVSANDAVTVRRRLGDRAGGDGDGVADSGDSRRARRAHAGTPRGVTARVTPRALIAAGCALSYAAISGACSRM